MKQIVVEKLSFAYRKDSQVFRDLSFEIKNSSQDGYVSAVMGSSGCGKSTFLKLVLGIEKSDSGRILTVPERPVISYVPQDPVLFEHLSPLQNAKYFERAGNYKRNFSDRLFRHVVQTLEMNDILEKSQSVSELSGGEKQRLSLIRALSIQPDILLLDEPLTGLDEEVKDSFLITLLEIIHNNKLLILYVTHHSSEVELVAQEVIYMSRGFLKNFVSSVAQKSVREFMEEPPTVSAAIAFKSRDLNRLKFHINGDRSIVPVDTRSSVNRGDFNLLCFDAGIMEFSDRLGFPFDIITQSGINTFLKLRGTNIVFTIKTSLYKRKNPTRYGYVLLNGDALLYDKMESFEARIRVVNNQIAS